MRGQFAYLLHNGVHYRDLQFSRTKRILYIQYQKHQKLTPVSVSGSACVCPVPGLRQYSIPLLGRWCHLVPQQSTPDGDTALLSQSIRAYVLHTYILLYTVQSHSLTPLPPHSSPLDLPGSYITPLCWGN